MILTFISICYIMLNRPCPLSSGFSKTSNPAPLFFMTIRLVKLCQLAIADFTKACRAVYTAQTVKKPEIPKGYSRVGMTTHPVVLQLITLCNDYQNFAKHHAQIGNTEESQFFEEFSSGILTIAKTMVRNLHRLTWISICLSKKGEIFAQTEDCCPFHFGHPLNTWAAKLTEIMRCGESLNGAMEKLPIGFKASPTDSRVHALHMLIEEVKNVNDEAKAQVLDILYPLHLNLILATQDLPEETLPASVGYDGRHVTWRTA